jgi:limonene-1,2-epoxide hydrolase
VAAGGTREAFVAAWPVGDATTVASFFSADAVYHNIPLAPVHGPDAIASTVAEFMSWGGEVQVEIANMVADGPVVMVERVDHVSGGTQTVSLPVVGVFEVHDGMITAWRDYFDLSQLAGSTTSA